MKRRGWRVALTVARQMVRDHAEAWWFQAIRETWEAGPHPHPERIIVVDGGDNNFPYWDFLFLATASGRPVIYDPDAAIHIEDHAGHSGSTDIVLRHLRDHGFRVVEQRFPRRDYVVVGYPEANPEAAPP